MMCWVLVVLDIKKALRMSLKNLTTETTHKIIQVGGKLVSKKKTNYTLIFKKFNRKIYIQNV